MIKANETPQEDRLVLSFSDVEMGAGGVLDDFPHSDYLSDLILSYNDSPYKDYEIDLVFNGDIFDFLKTNYLGEFPHFINKDVALGKLSKIAAAHPKFFEGLRKFLEYKQANRRVFFIVGNHDPEILFPEVQDFLKSLCGHGDQVYFPGFELQIGGLHVEHGSQKDPLFKIPPKKPFIQYQGETLLNIPWAEVAILDVMMPHQQKFYHLDRLKPKEELFKIIPEMKEWISTAFWHYWTQDFLRNYLKASNPLKKISWGMIKEVVRRFTTMDPKVSTGGYFQKQLEKESSPRVYLVGHEHEPGWWNYGDRKVLQTGCFRNEFMMHEQGKKLVRLPKTYAEIFFSGKSITRSQLMEVSGPAVPEGYIPGPVSDFRPAFQEMLQAEKEKNKNTKASKKQAKKPEPATEQSSDEPEEKEEATEGDSSQGEQSSTES